MCVVVVCVCVCVCVYDGVCMRVCGARARVLCAKKKRSERDREKEVIA